MNELNYAFKIIKCKIQFHNCLKCYISLFAITWAKLYRSYITPAAAVATEIFWKLFEISHNFHYQYENYRKFHRLKTWITDHRRNK